MPSIGVSNMGKRQRRTRTAWNSGESGPTSRDRRAGVVVSTPDADTVDHVMQTIEKVAESLGLSVRAVRLRRDALDGMIDAYIRRGDRNELLFTGEALAILRRVEDVRHGESLSVRQAASRIRGELGGKGVEATRQPESSSASSSSELSIMRDVIEDLRRDRDHWRDLALSLKDQLALPSPREERPRFRLWSRIVRAVSA